MKRERRKLAAILAADVVGYSRLMSENEGLALEMLRQLRKELLEPTVIGYGGEVIKRMGDGWLIEFQSAVDAVDCAVDIQSRLFGHKILSLRMGVHVGDIVHEDEDIFGDGVNIAARLQELSDPGSVFVSGDVQKLVFGKSQVEFSDLGPHELKNIKEHMPVFAWSGVAEATMGLETKVAEKTGSQKVPVILLPPLTVAGDEGEAADLAEELHSDLVMRLSRRSGIKVVIEQGDQFSPTYVLTGRCRLSGKRCRLSMVISTVDSTETIWADRFDGDASNFFDFIDEIAERINNAIRSNINAYAGAPLAARPDSDLSLDELLSKAAFLLYRLDRESAKAAQRTMEAAEQRAPDNAMVLAMRAWSLAHMVRFGGDRVSGIDSARATALANKAVELGPRVDFAFCCRAHLRLWLKANHEGCRADAKQALVINPGYHFAMAQLAEADIFGGRSGAGLETLKSIMQQVPTEPLQPCWASLVGLAYLLEGNEGEAIRYSREGYELKPNLLFHGLCYALAAAEDKAVASSSDFKEMISNLRLKVSDVERLPLERQSDVEMLKSRLRRAGLPE